MREARLPLNFYAQRNFWLFVLPSLLGAFLFMFPLYTTGKMTIPIALLADGIHNLLSDVLITIVTWIIVGMGAVSLLYAFYRPRFIQERSFIHHLLSPTKPWLLVRLFGAIAAFMTYFQMGPEFIREKATGILILEGLLPGLFSIFICVGFFLPLLLNFGLLEFFGTILSSLMRPLFNLPGRSAVDCAASWLGDGSVGILMTSKQYEDKGYTQREAAVVATTFSAVSITFTLIVIKQVHLEDYFLPFYATVCLSGFLAAIIVPRLPPLRWKKDQYIDGSEPDLSDENIPHGHNRLTWGLRLAMHQADKMCSVEKIFLDAFKNVCEMIFGILPTIMGIGTLALVLAEYTNIFDWLGIPFVPLLDLLNIPEANEAAKTIAVGFADMLIPSILASDIQSEMTRFIIAVLSVTQLIYMSEVGALLLASQIPVTIIELFVIFLLRTLMALPVIAFIAHYIFT